MASFTRTTDLPANSLGERTILQEHLDYNHAALALQVSLALRGLLEHGGTILAGSTTVENDTEVHVTGRAGILLDATAGVTISDQVIDLAPISSGIKCLVAAELEAGEIHTVAFTDVDTGQSLEHDMLVTPGRLVVIQGDVSDHPTAPLDVLPIARVTRGASVVTIDEILSVPPFAAAWIRARAVSTADRPTGALVGDSVFDTTLGHPIWWDGSDWVDAAGSTV